ncbi:MAG TPA: hypothetical protein VIO33_25980 [Burkholderiaceae bacterium]
MRRGLSAALAVVAASCLLVACGEKPQTLNTASKKPDAAPWAPGGAASNPFFASGWKGGDQAAWEAQIKTRNQGQNDYAR